MKKKIKRLISGILIIYVFLILFPQVLFANVLEYKGFAVYYHSDELKIENIKNILDKSQKLLTKSELYDNSKSQKIFICNSYNEFSFFALTSKRAFAVNLPIIQNIFLSKSFFLKNTIVRNGETNNLRKLSAIITHETTHSLLENKLGFLKFKLLPNWKNEGYCDYIAQGSSYNQEKGMKEICNGSETQNSLSFKYFKYRMLTKYLFEENNISIEKFLKNDFNLKELNENMKNKYCTQQR